MEVFQYLRNILRAIKGGSLGTGTVTTSTTGTAFVQLPNNLCDSVTFVNNTGVTLSVKVKAGTAYIPLFDGTYFTFDGINSAADLSIKRTDDSGTQVTITYTFNSN